MSSDKQPLMHVYSREQYATKQFWDARYKQKQSYFDWYAEFPELKQTFQKQYQLTHQNNILMLGCGNSKLSEQMYEAGYTNIFNIDISPAVIEQMKRITEERGYHKMKWEVMDATDMNSIADQTFDVIIDKGTLDALISGHNIDICVKMLKESMRVLKKNGQFILITYGSPQGRKKFFQNSIGLKNYDYYFTRVDLSSMSTLINLMRSNLGNKPLSSITKDSQAMKKSLMEFNLIKVLRRNRKNQKKYIIWSDIIKNPQPIQNENIFEKEQKKETKIQEERKQQKVQQNGEQNKQEKEVNKINYGPKKQSFCYVYSIKRKFALDMDDVVKIEDVKQPGLKQYFQIKNEGNKLFIGSQPATKIGVLADGCSNQLNRALVYLKKTDNLNNSVLVYSSLQQFRAGKEQIKLIIKQGNENTMPVYSKSVFEVQVPSSQGQMYGIEEKMRSVCLQITQNEGINGYPTPRNYAYLGILMQKLHIKSKYSEFLNQIWFPTYRCVSFSQNSVKYQISVCPTAQQALLLELIKKKFLVTAKLIHQGYINYFDPKVISLYNFCSTTYAEGLNANILLQQYPFQQYQLYHCSDSTLFIKKGIMDKVLAKMFSSL